MDYRKVWSKLNGPIPKDEYGRTYEIHHLDGNRKNDDISNLKCLSLQEHYDLHLSQGDYAAAYRIAQRLKISIEEKSLLMSKSNKARFAKGEHPFLNKETRSKNQQKLREKIDDGSFQFLKQNRKSEWQEQANKTFAARYNRSKLVEESWRKFKKENPESRRTLKGSTVGAAKTKGTKWYHKADGTQLRINPESVILTEGWLQGRFNGSDLMKLSAKKYSHKGKKKSIEQLKRIKEKKLQFSIEKFKKEYIISANESAKENVTRALCYYREKFGPISYPTFIKMKKIYNLT